MDSAIPVAEIAEIRVGLFKNRELVTWMAPYEGIPGNYVGCQGVEQFYRMPDITVEVEQDDLFCVAAVVIDEYGRERLYPDTPYALNEEEELFWANDQIEDKEDWYDGSTWSY